MNEFLNEIQRRYECAKRGDESLAECCKIESIMKISNSRSRVVNANSKCSIIYGEWKWKTIKEK